MFTPVLLQYPGLGDGWATAALNSDHEFEFFRLGLRELSDVQEFFIAGHMGVPFPRLIQKIYDALNITRPNFHFPLYSPRPNPGNKAFKNYRSHSLLAHYSQFIH